MVSDFWRLPSRVPAPRSPRRRAEGRRVSPVPPSARVERQLVLADLQLVALVQALDSIRERSHTCRSAIRSHPGTTGRRGVSTALVARDGHVVEEHLRVRAPADAHPLTGDREALADAPAAARITSAGPCPCRRRSRRDELTGVVDPVGGRHRLPGASALCSSARTAGSSWPPRRSRSRTLCSAVPPSAASLPGAGRP